ncbi:MAG: translocation/assembly module TamB domain-containing protein [Nitrospira sp.]|nr:translocation/assembly module TamB domain-containing protein [Nitrospira sp.]
MSTSIKKKKALSWIVGISILMFAIVFFLLRGPYLSNYIKRIFIPVLENVTRESVLIDKAVINLFPFYLQAKGLKVFDRDGNRLLLISKTRVYLDISGLLSGKVILRRITLKEPQFKLTEDGLNRILTNISSSSESGQGGKYEVTLKNLKLMDGSFQFSSAMGEKSISGKGLFVDLISRKNSSALLWSLKQGEVQLKGQAPISGNIAGKLRIKGESISVSDLIIHAQDSEVRTAGEILLSKDGGVMKGQMDLRADLKMGLINNVFGLKSNRDGSLKLDGRIHMNEQKDSAWPGLTLDMKTEAGFELETLMEIVNVQDNIRGKVSLKADITGEFPQITGTGKIQLQDGEFDTFKIDDVSGEIVYKDLIFALSRFTGKSYEGDVEGSASIRIPNGEYEVKGRLSSISSPQFFRIINWEPPFPAGQIQGDVQLSQKPGESIFITSNLQYANTTRNSGSILDRLQSIRTGLRLENDVLSLNKAELSTGKTLLKLDGYIDLNKDTLNLEASFKNTDARDITIPYYEGYTSPLVFNGRVMGALSDPSISGHIESGSGYINGIELEEGFADFTYKINSLNVTQLLLKQGDAHASVSGAIEFRGADSLFEFTGPYYNAEGIIDQAPVLPFIHAAYRDLPVHGLASGEMAFKGNSSEYIATANLSFEDISIYGESLDHLRLQAVMNRERIKFESFAVERADSSLQGSGEVAFDGTYKLSSTTGHLDSKDMPWLPADELAFNTNIKIEGEGSFQNPNIRFSADYAEGLLRDIKTGAGSLSGVWLGKKITVTAELADGRIGTNAAIDFSEELQWDVEAVLNKDNYNFLANYLYEEFPEEMDIRLAGNVRLSSRRNVLSAESVLKEVNIVYYGYNLKNEKDAAINYKGGLLTVDDLLMAGRDTRFVVTGGAKIGQSYNLKLNGRLDFEHLKELEERLSVLQGVGHFDVKIVGPWEIPELTGEIRVIDAHARVVDMPYKIGPINGSLYFKKDRITFEDIKTSFAGGSVTLSGVGFFDKFSLKRVFMSSDFNGIKVSPFEGLSAALKGSLFYEKSYRGSSFTGNVSITEAKYAKRLEWKSWLIGINEVQKKAVSYPAFIADTALNVRIMSDQIFIDNNIARAPVKLVLNVTGTPSEYGLIGRVEAAEGYIYFRSNEFRILEGSNVDFVDSDRIVPVLHILAETYANDYHVRLSLDGTIDQLILSLFSDPPLEENEILSLLTFGQFDKKARGIESGIAAGEATALLTGSLQDKMEKEFQSLTGFDRIVIEPHTTTEGAFTPKVTVGKRLLEDKVIVFYSSALGTAEEQVVKVKYKLDRNLSLEGSHNELGSTGLDLKYRFEFK